MIVKVKDGEGSLTAMGAGILVVGVLALLWLYQHNFFNLPLIGGIFDGPKAMSMAAQKKQARYVGAVAVTAQNNMESSGTTTSPTPLPVVDVAADES